MREPRLRWPVSIPSEIVGQRLENVARRAKYLLLEFEKGTLLVHLGMSGKLSVVSTGAPTSPHDHVDIQFDSSAVLRLNDPRRFGSILWQQPTVTHKLLANLGPEPFSKDFDGEYLFRIAKLRKTSIKNLLMDSRVVAGVGNIYANEALFRAGIRPRRSSRRISLKECHVLVEAIRATLGEALRAGGTTIRDYESVDGSKGYFSVDLFVYGRSGLPCLRCGTSIKRVNHGQRQTVYCANCQT